MNWKKVGSEGIELYEPMLIVINGQIQKGIFYVAADKDKNGDDEFYFSLCERTTDASTDRLIEKLNAGDFDDDRIKIKPEMVSDYCYLEDVELPCN